MLNKYFYDFMENETNQEDIQKINKDFTKYYEDLKLNNEQITFFEEQLFENQREYFKLGFKECFKWIKELNK